MVENKTRLHTILPARGAGVRFLEVVVTLAIREFEHERPNPTSRERRKINSRTRMYLYVLCYAVSLRLREEPCIDLIRIMIV